MASQNSRKRKSRSAAASTKVSDSSDAVSPLIQSFFNELTDCIKEMYKEYDQVEGVDRKEIVSVLLTVLPDRNGAMEGKKWPIMKVSKRKAIKAWLKKKWPIMKVSKRKVIKAGLKEHFQRSGKVFIAKFFRVLRRLREKYKKIKKKSIQGIKNISKEWKLAIRPIFLIAVIALVVGAVVAMVVSSGPMVPIVQGFASLVLSFFQFLQDWCENLLKEHGKKLCDEGSFSGSLKKTGKQNEDFTIIVEEFLSVRKIMERFTGASGDLEQLTNSFKRMMEDGGNALEKKKSQIKKKLTN